MSAATIHCDGAAQTSFVEVAALRWGEGHPGLWAVFFLLSRADHEAALIKVWETAVIDDFGNLVRMPR
jgi:hypothetical protein